MQFILNPIGTAGDIYPFLGMAIELRARGHEVVFVTNGVFAPLIASHGFEVDSVGDPLDLTKLASNRKVHKASTAWKLALKWCAVSCLQETFDAIENRATKKGSLLIAPLQSFASRIARDALQVPLVSLVLSPALLRSCDHAPKLPSMWMPDRMPSFMKAFQYAFADRFFVDPLLGSETNAMLAKQGLPAQKRFLNRWWYSPDLCLGMFEPKFAPKQADWPSNLEHVGFPYWVPRGDANDEQQILSFLRQGSPPVLLVPGSVGPGSTGFYRQAIEACRLARKRLLILDRHPEFLPNSLPDSVMYAPYAPLSLIASQCEIFIHSGGVGTTGQALVSGRPQLVCPRVNDQSDNAMRIVKLGVGRQIAYRKWQADAIRRALVSLSYGSSVSRESHLFAKQLLSANGIKIAANSIEEYFEIRGQSRLRVRSSD